MKKTLLLATLIAAFLLLMVSASANSIARLRVSVPFAFCVDKQLLPAGDYMVEIRPISSFAAPASSVLIRNMDGTAATWVVTIPGSDVGSTDGDYLRFHRYGDRYFLVNVKSLDYRVDLMTSHLEKELKAQARRAQETTLAAQK